MQAQCCREEVRRSLGPEHSEKPSNQREDCEYTRLTFRNDGYANEDCRPIRLANSLRRRPAKRSRTPFPTKLECLLL